MSRVNDAIIQCKLFIHYIFIHYRMIHGAYNNYRMIYGAYNNIYNQNFFKPNSMKASFSGRGIYNTTGEPVVMKKQEWIHTHLQCCTKEN